MAASKTTMNLHIDYALAEISSDEWFDAFEDNDLSRLSKLVSRNGG